LFTGGILATVLSLIAKAHINIRALVFTAS
jgi:predicted regulator of amino acid metabolism with ACT domain